MTRYSVQPRIFAKDYEVLSFPQNMVENIDKNIIKNLSCKYRQKLLDHVERSTTEALETVSKRPIQKTAEATVELNSNKIADKFTKVSKVLPQNNSKIVANIEKIIGLDREIPKERYVSPEKRQKNFNDLRLI